MVIEEQKLTNMELLQNVLSTLKINNFTILGNKVFIDSLILTSKEQVILISNCPFKFYIKEFLSSVSLPSNLYPMLNVHIEKTRGVDFNNDINIKGSLRTTSDNIYQNIGNITSSSVTLQSFILNGSINSDRVLLDRCKIKTTNLNSKELKLFYCHFFNKIEIKGCNYVSLTNCRFSCNKINFTKVNFIDISSTDPKEFVSLDFRDVNSLFLDKYSSLRYSKHPMFVENFHLSPADSSDSEYFFDIEPLERPMIVCKRIKLPEHTYQDEYPDILNIEKYIHMI